MREIKFRAWDKSEKEFLSSEEVINTHIAFLQEPIDTVWSQYTGLKDKNSKEIYEGDIVELVDVNGERIRRACEWLIGSFTFNCFAGLDTSCMEIIGNIYENPELLK